MTEWMPTWRTIVAFYAGLAVGWLLAWTFMRAAITDVELELSRARQSRDALAAMLRAERRRRREGAS